MASTRLGLSFLNLIVILIVILIAKGSLDNIDPSLQVGLLIVRDNWFDGEPTHPFRGWLLSATLTISKGRKGCVCVMIKLPVPSRKKKEVYR